MISPLTNSVENLSDEDLDKLVESGEIVSYSYVEGDYPLSQSIALEFPSGRKLGVHSWSTPAPESSGLSFETY